MSDEANRADAPATELAGKPAAANEPDQAEDQSAARQRSGARSSGRPNDGQEGQKKSGPPWYKRPLLAGGIFLAVLVIVIGGVLWWLHSRHYESTDDAAIDVVPQMVSAQVPGRVLRVLVKDNQEVAVDAVLVELDPADFEARAEQARAAGAQAQAQGEQALAQRSIFEAQRAQASANLHVAETNADNTGKDLARLSALRAENAGAVSQQQWDQAEAAKKTADAHVEAAQKGLQAAEAQIHYAGSLVAAAKATQASAAAQLREAELSLSYATIRAKLNGRVTNSQVTPGNYVQPGTPLMAVVPREVYVTANFKETQLAQMRRGQPVEVHVDAYPDLRLTGHVDSFQPGTGQTFSSLPAENATGNWVKVVQRIAVKIALDQVPDDPERRLGPGMSVVTKVTVR